MKHEHKEVKDCEHKDLKYCKECDVVECECGREWVKKVVVLSEDSTIKCCVLCNNWYDKRFPHYCKGFINITS